MRFVDVNDWLKKNPELRMFTAAQFAVACQCAGIDRSDAASMLVKAVWKDVVRVVYVVYPYGLDFPPLFGQWASYQMIPEEVRDTEKYPDVVLNQVFVLGDNAKRTVWSRLKSKIRRFFYGADYRVDLMRCGDNAFPDSPTGPGPSGPGAGDNPGDPIEHTIENLSGVTITGETPCSPGFHDPDDDFPPRAS